MGSGQSSATAGSSFSVDPSGHLTKINNSNNKQQTNTSETSNITDNNQSEQNYYQEQAPATPIDETQSFILTTNAAQSLDNSTISSNTRRDNGLTLKEADKIVSMLKDKHKPKDMAGKHNSVFDELERNLVQCYKENKNSSSLNCEKISKEYKNFVEQQRNQMLRKASVNVPLITTILVIITCLLLHITTVDCYGAMSVDLGSEWMKVGLVAPSVQMDIVLNPASQRKTPMAVAFSNNERFIGDTALDVASKYPERTFTHFLDLVGKTLEHDSVKHYKKRFPYIDITSHEPNSTSIILNHPEGLQFTPLELIAMMFQHALDQVTNRLNSNEPTNDVVITVPPFFEAKERKVIEDAAKLAGLHVLRLTNTNSAFAFSYGIFRHKDYLPENSNNKTTILFFDQGASSTSATLVDFHLVEQFNQVTGQSKNESLPTVTIRAQVYDRYLGGFDMQLKLRDHLVKVFSENTKVDESRVYKRGRSASKLLKEAGKVKKILSANTQHTVRVENVIDDIDFKHLITRQEFEELNQEYLNERVSQLLDRLFEMPNVSRDERLESVIIVGGNTRTPKIQQSLLEYFRLDTLGKSINADEGAALAALYQAASLGRGFKVKRFALEEYGDEKKRYDPERAAAYLATSTQTPPVTETTEPSSTESDESTTTTTTIEPITQDPNSIYSESELNRIAEKLAYLREQDFVRMQRLSLKNSLESLLSEGRGKLSDNDPLLKDKRDEIEKLIAETNIWLEDGAIEETDNVTLLADKYHAIQVLVHPRPPPPPPPPTFDPSSVDLSSMLNNETLNIFNAFKNFTNPFASRTTNDTADVPEPTADNEKVTTAPTQTTEGGATTTTPDPNSSSTTTTTTTDPLPEPSKVSGEGPVHHSEL